MFTSGVFGDLTIFIRNDIVYDSSTPEDLEMEYDEENFETEDGMLIVDVDMVFGWRGC